jgi:hypothetical protein
MASAMNQGRPDFPITGTLIIEDQSCYLSCPNGNVYTLWRSAPPSASPDTQAAQRATTYLQDQLNKSTNDPMTVATGFWPYAAPSKVLCMISAS